MENRPEYTDEQIASNYDLWETYADPHGAMSKREFDKLTIKEKLDALKEML